MKEQNIKARISFGEHEAGDTHNFIYDVKLLSSLNGKSDEFFINGTSLDVGTEIEIEGQRYKINGIRTAFFDKRSSVSDFNFEIAYFVEEIE